jgi:hypothetical protein
LIARRQGKGSAEGMTTISFSTHQAENCPLIATLGVAMAILSEKPEELD